MPGQGKPNPGNIITTSNRHLASFTTKHMRIFKTFSTFVCQPISSILSPMVLPQISADFQCCWIYNDKQRSTKLYGKQQNVEIMDLLIVAFCTELS